MKIQVESKGSVSVLMTQERPGSAARGPQHVMMKLQIYNTSPHFGKGIVSIMMLVRQGSTLTPQGEELLDRYLAFEKEAREAVFAAFEKHFKADDAFQK